jgi:hypothetical protein
MALLNASASTSVFFDFGTVDFGLDHRTKRYLGTQFMGYRESQRVFPVPGEPTSNKASPENFRDFMRSTTTPQACSMLQ